MAGDSESGKLTGDDLIDAGLRGFMQQIFDDARDAVKPFDDAIKQVALDIKNGLGDTLPATEAKIKLLNGALKDVTKGTRDYFQIQQQLNMILKSEKEIIDGNVSAYKTFSIENEKLRQTAKDLAIQYGISSKAALDATKAFNDHNEKLIAVDQSMNNYSRNVGNYSNSITGSLNKLAASGHVMRALGEAFEVHLGPIREYIMGVRGLVEVVEGQKEAMEANTVATAVNTEATEANTVSNEALAASNEEVGESWLLAAGIGGAVIAVLGAIVFAIYEYIEARKEQKEMDKEAAKAQSDGLKELIKLQDELLEVQQKVAVLTKTKTQDQVDSENAVTKAVREQNEAYHQKYLRLKAIGDMPDVNDKKYQIGNSGAVDISQFEADQAIYIRKKRDIDGLYQQEVDASNDKLVQSQIEADAKASIANEKRLHADLSILREIALERDDLIKDELKRELAKVETEREFAIMAEKDSEDTTEQKLEKIAQLNTLYDLKRQVEVKKYDDEQDKKREEQFKKEMELQDKMLKAYEKYLAAIKKAFDDKQKASDKLYEEINKQALQEGVDVAKGQLAMDEGKGLGGAKNITADKTNVENQEYYKTTQETRDKYDKELAEAKKNGVDTTLILQEFHKQQEIDSQNHENKLDEIKKAGLEKRLDAEKKNMDEMIKALQESLAKQNELEMEALKIKQDDLNSEIQVQATLAAAGKKNTLNQALADQAANQEQQKALARKAKQEQDALTYSSLLVNAVNTNVKAGDTFEKAIMKAVEDVFLTKSIAAGISGSFFEGTEDTGGPGGMDGRGGKLIIAHPHERIIDAEKNARLGGITNERLVDEYLAMKGMFMPVIKMDQRTDDQVQAKLFESAANKIADRLENVIQNQPQITSSMDGEGNLITQIIKNGNRTVIIKPNAQIIERTRHLRD